MRRCIALLLLVVFGTLSLVPNMDGRELLPLGALVEHYQHHVNDHGERNLSFTDFLIDHYAVAPTQQKETSEHSNLPLHVKITVACASLPGIPSFSLPPVPVSAAISRSTYVPPTPPSDCLRCPEHPPRG